MTDYAAMYDGYWSDPARWGTSSLRDVESTAEAVLNCCGGGRLLDVGCGMGALVRSLLRLGVDAIGLDVAQRCVDEGNRGAPGRFVRGSLLELPFEDGAFETVVSTDVLEHLSEADVPRALAEMARVSRRGVFVRVATTPDRDGAWHLTVRDRAWWEGRAFEAGLRRHPMMLAAIGYEALEAEGWQATLVMERVPAPALSRWPLEALRGERDLHMDMLREAGRRSDAHIARYWLACQFVRPGDVVLDAACGLGYGAAVLSAGSQASLVVGVDSSEYAVEYATANFGGGGPTPEPAIAGDRGDRPDPPRFRCADVIDLAWLGDQSVDVAVSFETLEHLADPGQFLGTLRRVLRPGGRVVLSVPNRWVDESGTDPNPHHLHVYDWDRLRTEVCERFLVEKRYAQVAGGGMTLKHAPRSLRESAMNDPRGPEPDAEWWLVVGMKDPVEGWRAGFVDRSLPDHTPRDGFNVAAFDRDYENPWLVRAMVAIGQRCTSKAELGAMALRVLDRAARGETGASSPDVGAAVCVLGYRLLDDTSLDAPRASDWLAQAAAFERAMNQDPVPTPHARRWVISNAYLAAQVLLAIGRRPDARDAFRRCAGMDVLAFSPLLASKTIDASWQAGLLTACDGDTAAAIADFRRGMAELVRVLSVGDWANIIGSIDEPLPFGLVDLQQGVEFAARCAFGISCAGLFADKPGLAWQLVRRRSMADLKHWSEQQQGAMEWLRAQRREYERALHESRQWIARQEQGRAWLEQHTSSLTARLEALSREAGDERERLRAVIQEQKRAGEWQAAQRRELEQRLIERDATIAELRGFIEAQRASIDERVRQKDARLAELQAAVTRLTESRDWALRQRDAFKVRAEVRGTPPPRAAPEPRSPE